ncbi:MAG: copper resistance D family protein [Candidatus Nitrosocosmicus sp.]
MKKILFIVSILLLSSCVFQLLLFPISNKSFSQQELDPSSDTLSPTGETQAVTSTNDAILKSILIISQVSVLGMTFNHLFFRIVSNRINLQSEGNKTNFINKDFSFEKRFTKILLLGCISIISASTGAILLQAYELSNQIQLDISVAFSILYSTSVGQVWIIRIITSLLFIGVITCHYMLQRKQKNGGKTESIQSQKENKKNLYRPSIVPIILSVMIIIASINLFSNSMVSHSNALKTFSVFAVPIDWLHFIAVSIWVGGLFYISLIILKRRDSYLIIDNKNNKIKEIKESHKILLLLTYFSYIAIVSLCIIGITGLYLALIHLQSIDAIFYTIYGKILIIKLSLAFPMILIGRYNQNKIQSSIKSTKDILISNHNNNNNYDLNIFNGAGKKDSFPDTINKSVKIELLLGISVLITASFLSITSPPSLATTTPINQDNINTNPTSNTLNLNFSLISLILSIIIIIIGIINFRLNKQKIRDSIIRFGI